MGGEKLWKILCQPVKNFRILAIFSTFIAYEIVDEFVTSCEKPVASQPLLLVRDETMKRSSCFIIEYNIYHVEERT